MKTNVIKLSDTRRLAERLGDWVWDGVLFNRDGITDPHLLIMPNKAGARIKRFIRDVGLNWEEQP